MADSSAGTAKDENESGSSASAASAPPPGPQGQQSSDEGASSSTADAAKKKRTRVVRTFPASSFMEALPLAEAIQRFGAGQKIRRLTLFDNLGRSPDSGSSKGAARRMGGTGSTSPAQVLAEASDLSKVCFLISPIGSDGSDQRKHANLVLGSLVEPALDALGLRLVRADKISKPGLITAQVMSSIISFGPHW